MQNLLPEAISQFETARQLDPTDPQIHFNLYRFYQKTGDRRRAQQAFQRYQQLQ
jgi:DNA-binding SARP family transcriptional activator